MVYVFLPYSLGFLALGVVMVLTARAPVTVLPRASLWFLAAFGFLHGFHEWIEMAMMIQFQSVGDGRFAWLQWGDLAFTSTSFAFAMQAGIEILIRRKRWPKLLRVLPGVLLLIWLAIILAFGQAWGSYASVTWGNAADALSRYILGLPAALLAAYALWVESKVPRRAGETRIQTYLAISAIAFACYAFFTGLVVPPAPFPLASFINTDSFLSFFHFPVEALRAIAALVIAAFLGEACVVESAWIQRRLLQLRDAFVSIVTFNLRSPITAINLSAGLLARLPAEQHMTEREHEAVKSIRTSTKNLNIMIDNLEEAFRVEEKSLELHKERVDLSQLIPAVLDRAIDITEGHQVKVSTPRVVPPVEADPRRVEKILNNLLSNAAKYSSPGSEIDVGVEVKPDEVIVSVANQGPGILPEEVPRIFERFYRPKAVEEAKAQGLGLGLYVAKELVEAMGGHMWVQSEAGRTTTFYFTLPRAKENRP